MAATSLTHSLSRLHPSSLSIRTIPISSSSSLSLSSHTFLHFSLIHHSSSSYAISPLTTGRRRSVTATISFSLPTSNPDRDTAAKSPKWSWRAIKSFAMGELEARKFKYPSTGTEAILMGILIEGTGPASKFLRANGITLTKVKEECIKLLGKGDFFFFSPEHPPLTESASKALDWAVDHKLQSGENGEITSADLLLGIWSENESPGYKVLAALGFDDEKAEELKTASSKPDFNEE